MSRAVILQQASEMPSHKCPTGKPFGIVWRHYYLCIVILCILSRLAKIPGQNNFLSFSVPPLRKEFRLTDTEIGTTFTLATVGASFFQPLLGYCFDRFGARICLPLAHVALCASLFYMTQLHRADPHPVAYLQLGSVFFCLRALSMGALEIYSYAALQRWFSKRRGVAVGVMCFFTSMGSASLSPFVSGMVKEHGWRSWTTLASVVNGSMAMMLAVTLRSSAEACGIGLDGAILDSASSMEPVKEEDDIEASLAAHADGDATDPQPGGEREQSAETHLAGDSSPAAESSGDRPSASSGGVVLSLDTALVLAFSLFYGIIFAGTDFEMVGIVKEAGAGATESRTPYAMATIVFSTLSITTAISTPIMGVIGDLLRGSAAAILAILILDCLVISAALWSLANASSPLLLVAFGVLRGSTHSVDQVLISSGAVFLEVGADKDAIGRMIGMNQFAKLAGTGIGPFVYGFSRDHLGGFYTGLLTTAAPMLMLSLAFAGRLLARLPSARRNVFAGYTAVVAGFPKRLGFALEEDAAQDGPSAETVGAPESESFDAPDSPGTLHNNVFTIEDDSEEEEERRGSAVGERDNGGLAWTEATEQAESH